MIEPTAPTAAVIVCFAVPDESRAFTAALANRRVIRDARGFPFPVSGELEGCPVVVGHTGIGDSAATRNHLRLLLSFAGPVVRLVVSAGYAGALRSDLAVGDLILSENHSAPSLAEKAKAGLEGERLFVGNLFTASSAAETAADKAALHRSTGALAVDMETAWIARACAARGLPLLSLRVISDAADQDFPVPGRILYDASRQRPRYVALPAWLALHPGRIGAFVRFVRGLGPARERLTRALQTVLAHL